MQIQYNLRFVCLLFLLVVCVLLVGWFICFIVGVIETGSHWVVLASLELTKTRPAWFKGSLTVFTSPVLRLKASTTTLSQQAQGFILDHAVTMILGKQGNFY